MNELNGKVAFVTGGASGIGFGIASALVDAGVKVALADIELEALNKAVKELKRKGANVLRVHVDVTDRIALNNAAIKTQNHFGNIHILCNNAGVASGGAIHTASYKDWDWVLGVNLGGVVNGVMTFVKYIKAHGEGGHIINTASLAGHMAAPGLGVYNTSKFAVVGLSETLRADLAQDKIGVSVLCPGIVSTQIHKSNRNRPQDLADKNSVGLIPGDETKADELIKKGRDPLLVGAQVVEAIRTNQLYIFTHPEYKAIIKSRMDTILDAMDTETEKRQLEKQTKAGQTEDEQSAEISSKKATKTSQPA